MLDTSATVAIVNPAAAGGRVGREWSALAGMLRSHLGEIEFVHTSCHGDGVRCARQAVESGATTLLSLGGDGTHNEVVNGIMAASPEPGAITLGILPSGTGGDFRRMLEHSGTLEEAARHLPSAASHLIDVGHLTYRTDDGESGERWFLNMTSFGIGGLVDRIVNDSSKRLGGKATFFLSSLRAMRRYTPASVQLTIDGTDVGTFTVTNIAVANGRWAGGGMMFAPEARLGDGLLDVIVIRDASLLGSLRFTPSLYRGEHLDSSLVEHFRGTSIEARTVNEHPAWLDVDGEAPGVLPAHLTCVPGALRLLGARDGFV